MSLKRRLITSAVVSRFTQYVAIEMKKITLLPFQMLAALRMYSSFHVRRVESEVRALKEKFLRGRGTPNLSNISDINVVCGCIKDFLRGLKEPLVTCELWEDFVDAAGQLHHVVLGQAA